MIIRYLYVFLDTDPILVPLLWLHFATFDFGVWLEVVASWRYETSVYPFFWRVGASFFGALAQAGCLLILNCIILVPYFGKPFEWVLDLYFYVVLASSPFVLFRRARKLYRIARLVLGPAARDAASPAIREVVVGQLTSATPLFTESKENFIEAQYEFLSPPPGEAAGSFTKNLQFAKHRTLANVFVVIKQISTDMEMNVEKVYAKIMGHVKGSGLTGLSEVAKLGIAELVKRGEKKAYAENEARALRAVKALSKQNRIIYMYSAHVQIRADGGEVFTIITKYHGQTWDAAARPASAAERLRRLSNACNALAAMHEGGMAHRDIKPDNIANDGVLLDVGLVLLPHGHDAHQGKRGCQFFEPPEAVLFSTSQPKAPLLGDETSSTRGTARTVDMFARTVGGSRRAPPCGPAAVWAALWHCARAVFSPSTWRRWARGTVTWARSEGSLSSKLSDALDRVETLAFGGGDRAVPAPPAVVQKGDVWSMGLVAMWYLLGAGSFKTPNGLISDEMHSFKDVAESGRFEGVAAPDQLAAGGDELRALLAAMLCHDPERRITAAEAATRFRALAGQCVETPSSAQRAVTPRRAGTPGRRAVYDRRDPEVRRARARAASLRRNRRPQPH
jgi:serine/threonine protein kinase